GLSLGKGALQAMDAKTELDLHTAAQEIAKGVVAVGTTYFFERFSGPDRPFFSKYADKVRGVGHYEFSKQGRIAGEATEVVVYWVVDKKTGQVLKVGDTELYQAHSRWNRYIGKAKADGKDVSLDYIRFEPGTPRTGPNSPENLLRGEFERQGHKLPWDRSGQRNP